MRTYARTHAARKFVWSVRMCILTDICTPIHAPTHPSTHNRYTQILYAYIDVFICRYRCVFCVYVSL